ncbi:hypothetical protein [Halobacterium sp. R2-5]|uniref:hypothetical protein n=1 Tax=Halobacterium sp. R2-5 TaxID=2715751 RepID=UPI0014204432|nr:hypothetical protein [Halobacterium sp. R2-5]NIB98040.1 hypothetical protein [Halobacterium sp. R2-5]
MSTVNQEPLGSVAEWAKTLLGRFIASSLVIGSLVAVASSPALIVLPRLGDLAVSFGWLAIVGVFLPFLNLDLDEDDTELLVSLMESIESATRREMLLYFMSYLLVLVSALSVLVLVTGTIASLLVSWTSVGLIGVGTAIFYPSIDIWVGDRFGWNIASTGAILAMAVLYLVAPIYRTNTSIPQNAARDARSFILSH